MIFTDSLSSLKLIIGEPETYISIVSKIKWLLYELNRHRTVSLHWIKAHCGIIGNEIADQTAQKGHDNISSELYEITKQEDISTLKLNFLKHWDETWKFTTDATGKGLFLRNIRDNVSKTGPVAEFHCRRWESVIHRLRMGHVGVLQYFHRFSMTDDPNCPECGQIETVKHYLLTCKLYEDQRVVMFRDLAAIDIDLPTVKDLLGGNEDLIRKRTEIFKILIKFISQTDRLKRL